MSLLDHDARSLSLINWLENSLALEVIELTAASSDASFRRYFRVIHSGGRHIVMDAPPEQENTEPFIRIAQLFGSAGLHVPHIFQHDSKLGFLLLEDLGSVNLLDSLNPGNAGRLYRQALSSLLKLQTGIDCAVCGLPAYDTALLSRELAIFTDWFLEKWLGVTLPISIRQPLQQLLIDSALEQPQVCVHRDFHSRNLMVLDGDAPGVIDFQDAVIGPISYDVVSLLRDCYIRWPETRVEQWAYDYYQKLGQAGLVQVDFALFKRWFDLMGLQRHLKAVGIFARLHLRDGKSGYLADIPRTMAHITTVCELYPELEAFKIFLTRQVLPIYRTAL